MTAEELISKLKLYKIPYTSEAEMQEAVNQVLTELGISFQREFVLSPKDRVDFLTSEGIAIECKVQGQPLAIHRQIKRYCKFKEVNAIILFTAKHMGVFDEINGKPAYVVKSGLSWL